MKDFSIEMEAEKIVNERTRTYFREVESCYNQGNYRSAIVMLWSTIVTDLFLKLRELLTTFSSQTAQDILTELETIRTTNPRSSDWEKRLIDLVYERTGLIDLSEFTNLKFIQEHRHLCAHPSLNTNFELYSPSRELTRAHIRTALETTLLKPAFLTKDLFDSFLLDISQQKAILLSRDTLAKYTKAKYFRQLPVQVSKHFFRSIWKLVFMLDNPLCNENRKINLWALITLTELNQSELINLLKSEPAFYSNISNNPDIIPSFIRYLSFFPDCYQHLNDAAKAIIESERRRNPDSYLLLWFINDNVSRHVAGIKTWYDYRVTDAPFSSPIISAEAFVEFCNCLEVMAQATEAYDLAIHIYGHSNSFDNASSHFDNLILPILAKLSEAQLRALIGAIETNNQTYSRRYAYHDHRKIRDAVTAKGIQINLADFPNFNKSLG